MNKTLSVLFLLLPLLLPAFACAQSREIVFASHGVSVPATLTLPDDQDSPCPIVVMAHGHGGSREENRGFSAIAQALVHAGIGSIRMDFSGCGESEEPFSSNCLTNMKEDICMAASYARTKLLAPSVGLFGYSMGGRAVLELLAEGATPDACALLAPANDTQDLIETAFEDFDALHEIARAEGTARDVHTGGSYDELGLAWFEDLLRYADPAAEAAKRYTGPSLVVWAEDDVVVRPHVSAHVAEVLGAQTYDATGKGHIYGFWLDADPLRERIAAAIADFFALHLPGKY